MSRYCDCDDGLSLEEDQILRSAPKVAAEMCELADRLQMGVPGDRPLWLDLRLLAETLAPMTASKGDYHKRLCEMREAAERRRQREREALAATAFDRSIMAGNEVDDALGDAWRAAS